MRKYNSVARCGGGAKNNHYEPTPDNNEEYPIRVLSEIRHLTAKRELKETYKYIRRKCVLFEIHKEVRATQGQHNEITTEWYCNDKMLGLNKIHKFVFHNTGKGDALKVMVTYEETMQ